MYRGRKVKNLERESMKWHAEREQGRVYGTTIPPTEFARIQAEYRANEAHKNKTRGK